MRPRSGRVIESLTTESPTAQCEDLKPSNEEPEGGIKSILDLDAISLCRSIESCRKF